MSDRQRISRKKGTTSNQSNPLLKPNIRGWNPPSYYSTPESHEVISKKSETSQESETTAREQENKENLLKESSQESSFADNNYFHNVSFRPYDRGKTPIGDVTEIQKKFLQRQQLEAEKQENQDNSEFIQAKETTDKQPKSVELPFADNNHFHNVSFRPYDRGKVPSGDITEIRKKILQRQQLEEEKEENQDNSEVIQAKETTDKQQKSFELPGADKNHFHNVSFRPYDRGKTPSGDITEIRKKILQRQQLEEEKLHLRKSSKNTNSIRVQLNQSLQEANGKLLDTSIASKAKYSFGTDFSNVRIHNDRQADFLTKKFGYKAFSYGSDLFFSSGAYQPSQPEGQQIIMHELAHVAQTDGRRAAGVKGKLEVGSSNANVEIDADRAAMAAMAGQSYQVQRAVLKVRGFGATGKGVTHENQTLTGAGEAGFSDRDATMIYSGNWQRDFNQLLVPAVEDAAPNVYEVLNILHTIHFGFPIGGSIESIADGSFNSASGPQEFGTYDPIEHIDNPGGLVNKDVFTQAGDKDSASNIARPKSDTTAYADADPRYQNEYKQMVNAATQGAAAFENNSDHIAHRVDQTGIPVYINASGTQMKRRFAQGISIAHRLAATKAESRQNRDRALRYAGEALHIMQDYYAHSNFCEIACNLLLNEGTRTLGDQDQNHVSADDLRQRLQVYDSNAGTHNLDTYVHQRNGSDSNSVNRDVNAMTRGGREIMATGTFTLEDTAHSIKEKAAAAINGVELFGKDTAGPSEKVLRLLVWLESNPKYVGNVRSYTTQIARIVEMGIPAIEGSMGGLSKGIGWIATASSALERNVGGHARRAWHRLAGGITGVFGGDRSAHDAAGANADRNANAAADRTSRNAAAAQEKINELTGRLRAVVAAMANGKTGLQELYKIAYEGGELVSLPAIAQAIPIIGPRLEPLVKKLVKQIKDKVKDAIKTIWESAKPQIIAEFNAAVALALGNTEVQRADENKGKTTSSQYTQPTHTDIAKDFHDKQHGTEERTSVIETVGEWFHRAIGGLSVITQSISSAYNAVQNGTKTPDEAVKDFVNKVVSAGSAKGEHGHEHQQRHGGAWLAGVAHKLATKSTQAILEKYSKAIDAPADQTADNIKALNKVIDSYYCHPADCRELWEPIIAGQLRGESATSKRLLREFARRTALPPSVQAPNDQQYSDD